MKNKREPGKILFLLFITLILTCSCTKKQDELLADINWEFFLNQHDMYWTTLTADPVEPTNDARLRTGYYAGAIMGNGLIGTNFYKLHDNVYRLNIGRSDITERRKPYNLFNSARLPIGYFTLSTVGKVQKEEMRLSLYNALTQGTFTTDSGSLKFSTFVHALKNYVIFETEAQGDEIGITWDFVPQKAISPRYIEGRPAPKDYVNKEGNSNPAAVRKVTNGTHYIIQKLATDSTLSRIDKVLLLSGKTQNGIQIQPGAL